MAVVTVRDRDLQQLVIARVGDTPAGDMAARIQVIWNLYSYLATGYPGFLGQQLQALYAQRDCIEIALAAVRGAVDTHTMQQDLKLSQKGIRLQAMLTATTAEITRVELQIRSSRGTVSGLLTTVTPETNPFGTNTISADDVAFRGDPYTPYAGGVIGPPVTTTG